MDSNSKYAPATGLTGDLVMWMLKAQWAGHMCRQGEIPYFRKVFTNPAGENTTMRCIRFLWNEDIENQLLKTHEVCYEFKRESA